MQTADHKKLLHLGPVFFLTGVVYVAGVISSQTLFVSRFGVEYLPVMYLIEAAVLPLQLWIISYLNRKVPQGTLIKVLYLIIFFGMLFAALFVFGMAVFDFQWRGFYPLLFIISNVLLRILVPLTWSTGEKICPLQQAKRIFSILGALFTLGAITSGILAQVFTGWFEGLGTEILLLLVPAVMLLSAFLWRYIIFRYFLTSDPEAEKKRGASMPTVIKTVWNTSFLRISLLSSIILLSLYYFIDYQFFTFINMEYQGSDAMTQFYGSFVAALYLVSLLAGLFINRLLNGVGIGNTVFFMGVTVLILLLASGFMAHGQWALQAFISADLLVDVLAFTLLPVIIQVFYKLLPPEQRAAAGMFFAGSINAGGKLISSGITGLHSSGMLPLIGLSVLGFGMALLYLFLTRRQKHLYFSALLEGLQGRTVRAQELESFSPGKFLGERDTILLRQALQSTDSAKESIALELSAIMKHDALFPYIEPFLKHRDPRKRLLAFRAVPDGGKDLEKVCFMMLQDEDEENRREAIRRIKCILKDAQRLKEVLKKHLGDSSAGVVGETVIALYDNKDSDVQSQVEKHIQAMLNGDDEDRFQICHAIREIKATRYAPQVREMLKVEASSRVRVSAVRCLGALSDTEAIPLMISLYPHADRELSQGIENALIQMDRYAIPELTKGLDSKDADSWSLCVAALALLDRERELETHLNQICLLKLRSLQGITMIPEQLKKEGFSDLAVLYELRMNENLYRIVGACWKTLAITLDPFLVERLMESFAKTHSAEKSEKAVEILAELSSRHPLAAEIADALCGDPLQMRRQTQDFTQMLHRSKMDFPDPWLDRFANYAIGHYQSA